MRAPLVYREGARIGRTANPPRNLVDEKRDLGENQITKRSDFYRRRIEHPR